MKKLLSLLLAITVVLCLGACTSNREQTDEEIMETAHTVYNVSGSFGSIDIDEDVAKTLLGVFEPETLGLSKPIDEYDLQLNATRLNGKDACSVEAFEEGGEAPVGIYAILEGECFVYDSKKSRYLLLTPEGAVEIKDDIVEATEGDETNEETTQAFPYDAENNKMLQKRFGKYTTEQLFIPEKLSEYVLVVDGNSTIAAGGEKVYIIRLYEKDGTQTDYTLAFSEGRDYAYNSDYKIYIEIE